MYCPKCGVSNEDAATFCKACGEVLPLPAGGFQQSRGKSEEPDNAAYYKAVLGSKNQDYYLSRFARFDADGKTSASWHWPAFFITFYWLLYRKMWLPALGYFLLPYLFGGLMGATAGLRNGSANLMFTAGYFLYVACILFLPPLYANSLYYNHCRKKISAVKASKADVQRQLGELAGKGGTSGIVMIILLFFVFIALLGIVAAVAIPAYQDYTTRARVAQAYEMGKSAADSVTRYYNRNQTLPGSLDGAGYIAAPSHAVREIDFDNQSGTLTVIISGAAVDGKSLALEPALDEGRQLYWNCSSAEIKDRYLPRACRHNN
jgi:Tfp pilus assembly protein PilE